ncbi:MAG: DUF1127 domain-containing protein [Pseudomonadota bacterium]
MAYATAPITSRFNLVASLRGYGAELVEAWAQYRQYSKTYYELNELSDRELDDLGLSRASLKKVAWETSHAA